MGSSGSDGMLHWSTRHQVSFGLPPEPRHVGELCDDIWDSAERVRHFWMSIFVHALEHWITCHKILMRELVPTSNRPLAPS